MGKSNYNKFVNRAKRIELAGKMNYYRMAQCVYRQCSCSVLMISETSGRLIILSNMWSTKSHARSAKDKTSASMVYTVLMSSHQACGCDDVGFKFMLRPRPPESNDSKLIILFSNCIDSILMEGSGTDTDTMSMDGKLFEIALGPDLDGLTDSELDNEIQMLSDDTDNENNNTVKEKSRPTSKSPTGTPKLPSVLVVPSSSKSTLLDWMPKVNESKSSTPIKDKRKNRSGSQKRDKNPKSKETGSLVSMLSKVTVSTKTKTPSAPEVSSKRNRSPGTALVDSRRPAKHPKIPGPKPNDSSDGPVLERSYSEIVKKTLQLKICLAEKKPEGNELKTIRNHLEGKVIEALEKEKFIPVFEKNWIGEDGVYVVCADFSCAEWVAKMVKEGIPGIKSKLAILPHDIVVKLKLAPEPIRVVTRVFTRKPNEFILDAMAKLNKNLNTEGWKIRSRRNHGTHKLTLFMKVDQASYEQIQKQGNKINWIMGSIVMELERPKGGEGKTSAVPPTKEQGSPSPATRSTNQTSARNTLASPKVSGLTRKGGSGPKGNSKLSR